MPGREGGVDEYGGFLVMTNGKQLMAQAIGCKRLPFIYFTLKGVAYVHPLPTLRIYA